MVCSLHNLLFAAYMLVLHCLVDPSLIGAVEVGSVIPHIEYLAAKGASRLYLISCYFHQH